MGVVMPDLELSLFVLGYLALSAGIWLWLGLGPALAVAGTILIVLALVIAYTAQIEQAKREALDALKRERETI